jgi:hypothetical protein
MVRYVREQVKVSQSCAVFRSRRLPLQPKPVPGRLNPYPRACWSIMDAVMCDRLVNRTRKKHSDGQEEES